MKNSTLILSTTMENFRSQTAQLLVFLLPLKTIFGFLAAFYGIFLATPLHSEGTYEIKDKIGGNADIWIESYGRGAGGQSNLNLPRSTVFFVDVLFLNEVIDIYTSRYESAIDIEIWAPGDNYLVDPSVATFDVVQNGTGHVANWTEITQVQNIGTRPRAPFTFTPSSGTGVYTVRIYGLNTWANTSGLLFFDLMVRDTKGTGGEIDDVLRRGRLWSKHLAMNGQSLNAAMSTNFYMIDGEDQGTFYEGYLWQADLNGIQPFGFHMFTNRNGAFPAAHHNTSVAQNASPTPQMVPQYQMYFNYPEKPVINPTIPSVENLVFRGDCVGGVPQGGFFEFETNGDWTFEIVLDENNDNEYDRGTERTISGPATVGFNSIFWDGLTFDGTPAPDGLTIKIVLRTKSSEIHFPFFDVENNSGANGPLFSLVPFDNATSERYYWDDRPLGGTFSGAGGSLSSHIWNTTLGNNNLVDTWKVAFEDIAEYVLLYNCTAANMIISKIADVDRVATNDIVTFRITALNAGPAEATGIEITDVLPAGLVYQSHTATSGTFTNGTGVWAVPNKAVGGRDTLFIQTQVQAGYDGQTITNTAAITALDNVDPDVTNNTNSQDIIVGLFRIQGTVFEDVNYAGGAGRNLNASGSNVLFGVTVELYNGTTGDFIATTVTNLVGQYSFSDLEPNPYTVRVVNTTVKSQRQGGDLAGSLGVQTYTTNAPAGVVVPVTNKIGGEDPAKTDAGANAGAANLSTLTSGNSLPQSLSSITIVQTPVTAVNFGFNFNTVVNTNDAGQGSLRQFIANANRLSNNTINQVGLDTDYEHAVFMIPNTDANFDGQKFTITLATALPNITDSFTSIDGALQTAYTGDTNAANGNTTLGPEIIIDGPAGNIFNVLIGPTRIANLGLTGVTGATATDAPIILANAGASGVIIENNTIWGNDRSGIYMNTGSTTATIRNNIIRNNGVVQNDAAGIHLQGALGSLIQSNIIHSNPGEGITLAGTSNTNTITQNTIFSNGGGGSTRTSGVAIRLGNSNIISLNTIHSNTGDGVLVTSGTQNRISQNSIYTNGNLSIDLGAGNQGDDVSLNDSGDGDTGPNNLLNFPVITNAFSGGGNLTISGFARPGSIVEVFRANADPTSFGEGELYLFTVTEGTGDDADGGSAAYSGLINGVNQGADNTNRFTFTVSNPPGIFEGTLLTATATDGNGNTSEFSGVVSVVLSAPSIFGFVYEDVNHNASRDGNETGTGIALFAKLINTGSVVQTAAVNSADGDYEFTLVAPGSYSIIIDDNNNVGDLVPAAIPEWIGTEFGSLEITPLDVSSFNLNNQNFGLFHGAKISGTAFYDNGTGGGSGNDGIRNGTEAGFGGVEIRITDNAESTLYNVLTTPANGSFTTWVPHTANGTVVKIIQKNASGFISTGGQVGTTGGTYTIASDIVSFVMSSGQSYTGISFGDVAPPRFFGNNQRSTLPGTVIFVPHQYEVPTSGSLAFTFTNTSSSAAQDWSILLYNDANQNGTLDAGEVQYSTSAVSAGQVVHLVAKITVPPNAPIGSSFLSLIQADLTFDNAVPTIVHSSEVSDFVTVEVAELAGLELVKTVDKSSAKPGETISYTVEYKNVSSQPLQNIVINDATPPYTTFSTATFGALPQTLTNCTITAPLVGEGGSIVWSFIGSLLPGSIGTVSFSVIIVD